MSLGLFRISTAAVALTFASSCSLFTPGDKKTLTTDLEAPLAVTLVSPSYEVGGDSTPSLEVTGVRKSLTVPIHSSPDCAASSLLGSGVATGTSIVLTSAPLPAFGSYLFYAKTADSSGKSSPCSSAYASYQYAEDPALAWAPLIQQWGDLAVGGRSPQVTFTLSNVGGAAQGCSAPELSNSADFSIVANTCTAATLGAAASCTVKVRANPRTAGVKKGALTRTCRFGGTVSTTSEELQVTGTTPIAPQWNVTTQDLGTVQVGSSSDVRDVYFQNPATLALSSCSAPTLSDPAFVFVSNGCTASTLAAGAQCKVTVKAQPTSAGALSATLSRTCGSYTKDVTLSATATAVDTVAEIATGAYHACARFSSGKIWCWGSNFGGELGDGTTQPRSGPVTVSGISSATALAVGSLHSCALVSGGTVKCWGQNWNRQTGIHSGGSPITTPTEVPGISGVTAIASGYGHSCALLASGGIKCWGQGPIGNSQANNWYQGYAPMDVAGITNAVAINSGSEHVCAKLSDNSVQCWGRSGEGQLGNGATSGGTTPVTVSGLTDASALSLGYLHSCALTSGGSVKCWGSNSSGQIGDGTGVNRLTPVTVSGLNGITQLSSNGLKSCALLSDASVKCWGNTWADASGSGTNLLANFNSPTVVSGLTQVSQLAISPGSESCALLSTGGIKCWGNYTGIQMPSTVPGLSGVTSVLAGNRHSCAIVSGGAVKCWGSNEHGKLGDGTTTDSVTPVSVIGVTGATQLTTGWHHTCALIAGGTVKCWGVNWNGQLGTGAYDSPTEPVTVSGVTQAIGIAANAFSTCALLSSGTVQCWGGNDYGQLGDGTTTDSPTPVTVSALSGATAITAGDRHVCALLSDKTVKCWGQNQYSQLGDGTTTNRSTPVAVSGLSSVTSITSGLSHTCAILEDTTLKCWGPNQEGEVGDGTTTPRNAPVALSGIADVVEVSLGLLSTIARFSDGSLMCWGRNNNGYCALGTIPPWHITNPTLIPGFGQQNPVIALSTSAMASNHACVILPDHTVQCWGQNDYLQTGATLGFFRTISGL